MKHKHDKPELKIERNLVETHYFFLKYLFKLWICAHEWVYVLVEFGRQHHTQLELKSYSSGTNVRLSCTPVLECILGAL